jgi:hypothetical protein
VRAHVLDEHRHPRGERLARLGDAVERHRPLAQRGCSNEAITVPSPGAGPASTTAHERTASARATRRESRW